MENSIEENMAEGITAFNYSGICTADFATANYIPGPGDEDDAPEPEEGSDDENPAIDPDIVHSPVPTQTGGKPPQT